MMEIEQHRLMALLTADLADALARRLAERVITLIGESWSSASPAAEGSPPAIRTGTLAGSITLEAAENGYRVGSAVAYAADLEFGTGRMGARPWLRPAVEGVRGEANALASAALIEFLGTI